MALVIVIASSLFIWLFLLLFWGQFWQANQRINLNNSELIYFPTVWAIVPARDEAEVIETSLNSLLNQEYKGNFHVVLVDDNSRDRTANLAQKTAVQLAKEKQLTILPGKPLDSGWKGKLWAMHQGIEYAQKQTPLPDYFLFTDADIYHDRYNLHQLITKAETEDVDLVSLMVLLHCKSLWEKLLIPAFVFFFQKLYPFPWVNNPGKSIAAAAGGCTLISNKALLSIGGIVAIKDALIDDCSLAKAVKSQQKNIWLGLSETTTSLRPYDDLKSIWDTVARTAFAQLNYSFLLLIGTLIGMSLVYLATPICFLLGIQNHDWLVIAIAVLTWLLMIIAYLPTTRLYSLSIIWTLALPAIAFLYTLMTIDSAIKYYRGQGGAWKGRTYQ